MEDHKILAQNPVLYSFLPLFYMVWADAILTPSEIEKIRLLIDKQTWLTGEEKKYLLSFLDPQSPPSPNQLKGWLEEIKKTADQFSPEMKESLVDIGIKLAQINARSGTDKALKEAKKPLLTIEDALGIR